jgi:hypothetical protein
MESRLDIFDPDFSPHLLGPQLPDRCKALIPPSVKLFNIKIHCIKISNQIIENSHCEYYAIWDPTAIHGREYLSDYRLATRFSAATAFGMANYFKFAKRKITIANDNSVYGKSSEVLLSPLMLHQSVLSSLNFYC